MTFPSRRQCTPRGPTEKGAAATRTARPGVHPDTKEPPHASNDDEAGTLHVDSIFIMYEFDKSPFGMGDGGVGGRPGEIATDLGLYGSSHVGYLGGIVETTDVEAVLRINLLKTDWYHRKAPPTYLYYNPHPAARTVTVDVGDAPVDLYDAASGRFLTRKVTGKTKLHLAPDTAAVMTLRPHRGP